MESVIWKPVVGFEGHYEVSDLGQVRSVRTRPGSKGGHILKPQNNGRNYLHLGLCVGGKVSQRYVHRLVAETFFGPPNGKEVNHKNGNPLDNRAENLEWMTKSQNHRHMYDVLKRPGHMTKTGSAHHNSKTYDVAKVFHMRALGATQCDIARSIGCSDFTVGKILNGTHWQIRDMTKV